MSSVLLGDISAASSAVVPPALGCPTASSGRLTAAIPARLSCRNSRRFNDPLLQLAKIRASASSLAVGRSRPSTASPEPILPERAGQAPNQTHAFKSAPRSQRPLIALSTKVNVHCLCRHLLRLRRGRSANSSPVVHVRGVLRARASRRSYFVRPCKPGRDSQNRHHWRPSIKR
jgi:hypothetical protein